MSSRSAILLAATLLSQAGCARPEEPASNTAPAAEQDARGVTDAAKSAVPAALLAAIKADLATRRGVPADSIGVISSESLVWRDLSLGCGKPNEFYEQVEVTGYRILLESGGERFDYRARDDGPFILCESGLPAPRAR